MWRASSLRWVMVLKAANHDLKDKVRLVCHDMQTTVCDMTLHHTNTDASRWLIWTLGRVRQAGTRMVPCALASAAMSVSDMQIRFMKVFKAADRPCTPSTTVCCDLAGSARLARSARRPHACWVLWLARTS